MNILTKICVVLLTVVSIAASITFINWVTTQDNYKHKWKVQLVNNIKFEQENRLYSDSNARLTYENQMLARELLQSEALLASQKATAAASLASKNEDYQDLKATHDALVATYNQLRADLNADVKNDDILKKQILAAHDKIKELELGLSKANTIIGRLRADNKIKTNSLRLASVRSAELQAELVAVRTELENRDGQKKSKNDKPLALVNATIIEVKGNLATINVGSNQGIKEGRRLFVYRKGGKFVGFITIQNYDVDEATGILSGNKIAPQVGDKVTSDF